MGKGSAREPRLIDMRWGKRGAPQVTLVGKGVCFDTGGLDIKPSSNMLLMKKDMGGAAVMLALARCIMALALPVLSGPIEAEHGQSQCYPAARRRLGRAAGQADVDEPLQRAADLAGAGPSPAG